VSGVIQGMTREKKKKAKGTLDKLRGYYDGARMLDYDGEGLEGWDAGNEPTITRSGMPKGRNPHVGLHIPAPTASERAARERARRQRRGGSVRAANRR